MVVCVCVGPELKNKNKNYKLIFFFFLELGGRGGDPGPSQFPPKSVFGVTVGFEAGHSRVWLDPRRGSRLGLADNNFFSF
jgi:hypothetical protein